MNERPDYDARLSAVEGRLDAVESEASAARHLAAFNDRDLADLGVKVEANRRAINALGQQTAEQFADVRAEMRAGFADVRAEFTNVRSEMRAGFAATRAGFAAIGAKLDQLIVADDGGGDTN